MELIEGQRVLLLHAGDYHVVNSAAVHATRTTTPSRVLLLQIPYAFLIGAIPEYESIRFLFSRRDSSVDAQIQEILTSNPTTFQSVNPLMHLEKVELLLFCSS